MRAAYSIIVLFIGCSDTIRNVDKSKTESAQHQFAAAQTLGERMAILRDVLSRGTYGEINGVLLQLSPADKWAGTDVVEYLRVTEAPIAVEVLVETLADYGGAFSLMKSGSPNNDALARALARSNHLDETATSFLEHQCRDLPLDAWGILFRQTLVELDPEAPRQIDYVCAGLWAQRSGLQNGDILLSSGDLRGRRLVEKIVSERRLGVAVRRGDQTRTIEMRRSVDPRSIDQELGSGR